MICADAFVVSGVKVGLKSMS